jgi:hypothetical protein
MAANTKSIPLGLLLLTLAGRACALDALDNLTAWENAEVSERADLAQSLVKVLSKSNRPERLLADARFLINCISLVAESGDKNAKVQNVASACWRMGKRDEL